MHKAIIGVLGLAGWISQSSVACPDFLNTEMRKLASTEIINFCEIYPNKPLLIVNTASNCGYTHQLAGLEQVHQRYQSDGLVVIGFSSDDFFQEEDNEEDAAEVCFDKYEVTFPVMATSSVRGENANPVFKALGDAKGYPRWNFSKYIVNAEGEVVAKFHSDITPNNPKLRATLASVLNEET
jgi:glutathione peroxidase